MIATFATGQGMAQGLNLLTGFLLLRWLTVDSYAQYSVATAFQKTLGVLADLGLQGSIVALVGTQAADPHVVGGYLRVARVLRGRLFWAMALLSAIAFPLITWNQPWPAYQKALLWGSVVVGVFFQGQVLYGAPLLIRKRLTGYYKGLTVPSALRLLGSGALYLIGVLNGWMAAMVSAFSLAVVGRIFRKEVADVAIEPEKPSEQALGDLKRYLYPLIPAAVYYAFQDQIAIGIISVVGQSKVIAEFAALGRLSQLFMVLAATNAVFVSPFLARATADRLRTVYAKVALLAFVVSFSIAAFAFAFPAPFVWLMGPKYTQLGNLVGWSVLAGSVTYFGGVVFTMNAARRWTFYWASWTSIAIALVTQVVAALLLPVHTTAGAVAFSVATSVAVLLGVVPPSVVGLKRGI